MQRLPRSELLEASGLSGPNYDAYCRRGQFFPSADPDKQLLQARLFAIITAAGGTPRSATLAWAGLADERDPGRFSLWIANAPGQGVKLVPHGAEQPTATHRFVADLGAVVRDLERRKREIEARRIVTDPTAYPYRLPFVSPVPGAAWTVLLAEERQEPDAECIARITDAVEARSSILVAATSEKALASAGAAVLAVIDATARLTTH